MKIIGITGPTGAGKTTALNALVSLGACVIDADEVYHSLLEHCVPMQRELTARFGDICDEMGKIDRKKLGNVVFGDPAALADLNAITHRYVVEEMDRLCAAARAEGRPAAAIDAIALVECGAAARCDAVVGILAPKELRIRRIMEREGISETYARSRVEAQQGDEFFRAHCGHVLENDGSKTPAEFQAEALTLFRQLLAEG